MIYGYARCSTNEKKQDIDRQKRDLRALGVKDGKSIFWEYESGTKADRAELGKAFNILKVGDTLVTTEVSRLTRSTKHLCELIELVREKRVKLIIGSFVVDCTKEELDPMTEGMLMMWGVFADMERKITIQRIKSGIQNAKAKGKILGRPPITSEGIPSSFIKHYPKYKAKELNVSELARLCGFSRTTVYKYIEMLEGK